MLVFLTCLSVVQSSFSSKYGHSFDLTKGMAREKVEAVETISVDLTGCEAKSVDVLYQNPL